LEGFLLAIVARRISIRGKESVNSKISAHFPWALEKEKFEEMKSWPVQKGSTSWMDGLRCIQIRYDE